MAIPIACGKCGKTSEHEERWRGCLRPCPQCGEKVAVPEDERLVEKPVSIDALCFCGARQAAPEEGLWYRVTFRQAEEPSEWGGRYFNIIYFVLLFACGPLLTLLALFVRRSSASAVAEVRWACPSCQRQVVRAARWRTWGAWLVFLLFVAGPWGGIGWLLQHVGVDALDRRLPSWRGLAILAVLLGPILAWIVWRIGLRVLAWGFASANAGHTSLVPLFDACSPVLLHPDGQYFFSPRGGSSPAPG